MTIDIKGFRIFIASPGGLAGERRRFRSTIVEYNEDEAVARGVTFLPVGWEDTLAGVGRPQAIINEDVKLSDYFVLVLWDRWGTPPSASSGKYTSGTEEEFQIALQSLADANSDMRKIVVLFKGVDVRQLSDPGEQLDRVLEFRRQIEAEKSLLYQTFDTEEEFGRIMRKHLAQWVRDHETEKARAPVPVPVPSIDSRVRAAVVASPRDYESIEDLLREAEALAAKGHAVDAEALFARAIVGSRSIDARIRFGRFLRRYGRLAQARSTFENALQLANEISDHKSAAWSFANLGVIARHQNDLGAAEEFLRKALSRAESIETGGQELLAYASGNLAQILMAKGALEEAERIQREALALQRDRPEDAANSLGSLGVILRRRKRWKEAEQVHREGIELSESLGDKGSRTLAYNCGCLGLVLEQTGQLQEALECHKRALAVNEKFSREEGQALNLAHIAMVLMGLSRLDEAEEQNGASMTINSRRGNLEGLAYNYSVRGRIAVARGQADVAEKAFQTAVELYDRIGHNLGLASNSFELAKILVAAGEIANAIQMLSSAEQAALRGAETDLMAKIRFELARLVPPPTE